MGAMVKACNTVSIQKFLLILLPLAFLGGCASQPEKAAAPEDSEAELTEEAQGRPTIADRPFTSETFYALLVAEMAIDRKRYDIALGNYVQQAMRTNDLLVTERATQIARGLNARQSALEMSQLWLEIDPTSPDARLVATIELIEANYLLEAFEISKQMLADGAPTAFETIAAKAEKGDINVVNTLSDEYGRLLQRYKEDPSLWIGHSILLQQQGRLNEALRAAESAIKLDPESLRSAFQETRVLHQMGRAAEASERLGKLVEKHPDNIGLRARYARLIWSTSPETAREQFSIIHQSNPEDAEILYSLALVEKDLGLLDEAKSRFDLLLSRDQYADAAHFHLGEIHESRHEDDLALQQYLKVTPGRNYLSALVNASEIHIKQNRREEAVKLIKSEQANASGETLESLFAIEAAIYSKAGQMNAAEKALSDGIKQFPTSTRLLYARAMLYTQIDYISAAESDLKRVLELAPQNAAALNALGYTLADRTDRYEEARGYIQQAYALTPTDPAVIDSMGWIAYRLGNIEEALTYLRKAMNALPDHEIAAHLGEVLWISGQKKEAISVWKKGLELEPESKIIHQTLHRLEAQIE